MTYQHIKTVIENFKGRNLAFEIFRQSLIGNQRKLLELLPFNPENAKTCKEIADAMGITSANCSAQLHQLQGKFGLIQTVKVNKKTKYYI